MNETKLCLSQPLFKHKHSLHASPKLVQNPMHSKLANKQVNPVLSNCWWLRTPKAGNRGVPRESRRVLFLSENCHSDDHPASAGVYALRHSDPGVRFGRSDPSSLCPMEAHFVLTTQTNGGSKQGFLRFFFYSPNKD